MSRAIILSAGQGRRLLPLTESRPKCLLEIGGRTILQWQIDALLQSGVHNICIITGFHNQLVETHILSAYPENGEIITLYNPFYCVSDNLASCWLARQQMDGNFLLINGDTVFEPAVLQTVLESPEYPITLATDNKHTYDEDDMKVSLDESLVLNVSKTLNVEQTNAESIGMLYFRGEGPQRFRAELDAAMSTPAGLQSWFLSVVDNLAGKQLVQACPVSGKKWAEIDFISDLEAAETLLA